MMSSIAEAFVHRAMNWKAHQIAFELRSGFIDLAIISRVAPMLGFSALFSPCWPLSLVLFIRQTIGPFHQQLVVVFTSA